MILDVGAKLCGHASLITDASREILECRARDEDKLPVIAMIQHFNIFNRGNSLIIS